MQRGNALSIFSFDGKLAISKDKDSFYILDNAIIMAFSIQIKSNFSDSTSFGDDYKTREVTNSWGEIDISLRCGNVEIRSGQMQEINPFNSAKEVQRVAQRISDFSTLQRCIDF